MKLIVLVVFCLAGCGGSSAAPDQQPSTPPPQPAVSPAPVAPATPPAPAPAPSPPPAPAAARTERLRASGDLDGVPGPESIVLYSDGTIEAAGLVGQVTIPTASEYFEQHQSTMEVVLVDRAAGVRGILVGLPTESDEDPPNRWQLVVKAGTTLRLVLDATLGVYGVTALSFPGDGSVHYVEDGWTACERAHHPRTVRRQEVTLRPGPGGMMVEAGRRPTAESQRCDQLAACPAVYLLGDAGPPAYAGEILRDLRGAAAYALQSLPVGAADGELRVRLAEEKPETTYLDEIYLEVGGERITPRACSEPVAPRYCVADGAMHLLREGETLDLVFDAPAGSALLQARGYYVPTQRP